MASESRSQQEASIPRGRHQFSVRDLLVLTAAISIALAIAVLSRGSKYVGALASPWTWVSLVPVALVWVFGQRTSARRWLVRGSLLAYVVALCAPAIGFGWGPAPSVEFGAQVWVQSYAFGLGYLENLVLLQNPRVAWPIDEWEVLACALGAIANSLLIAGWIALFLARRRRKRPIATRWLARISFVLMFASLIPIACVGELSGIYPGFGLWAASALMLALRY